MGVDLATKHLRSSKVTYFQVSHAKLQGDVISYRSIDPWFRGTFIQQKCKETIILEILCHFIYTHDTVDGRNFASPGMYKALKIMGNLLYQQVSRISEPSTVVGRGSLTFFSTNFQYTFPVGSMPKMRRRYDIFTYINK